MAPAVLRVAGFGQLPCGRGFIGIHRDRMRLLDRRRKIRARCGHELSPRHAELKALFVLEPERADELSEPVGLVSKEAVKLVGR